MRGDQTVIQHLNAVLKGEPYTVTCGPVYPGVTCLPEKKDAYNTTRGTITLAEYNRLSQETVPPVLAEKYRYLCDRFARRVYTHFDVLRCR